MFVAKFLHSLGFNAKTYAKPFKTVQPRCLALENLEDRNVPTTFQVSGGGYAIQTALLSAHNNDKIVVNAGTYTVDNAHLLTISQSNLQLVSAGDHDGDADDPIVVIKAGSLSNNSIVNVTGSNDLVQGFIIDGSGNQSRTIDAGIRVTGSASIYNNTIQNLYNQAIPNSLNNRVGTGIRVGDSATGQTGTAKIYFNNINTYHKSGVIVSNTHSSADIKGNTITGVGATPSGVAVATEQYGVSIVDGAAARVRNNTITQNNDASGVRAGGILINNSSAQSAITNNYLDKNEDGVILSFATNAQVYNNDVTRSGADGILLLNANSNSICDNYVFGNGTDKPAGSGPGGGISAFDSASNLIADNEIDNNVQDGIYLDNTNTGVGYNTFQDNNLQCNGNNGLYLYNTCFNRLIDNGLVHNSYNGILIEQGGNNYICDSTSVVNILDGIQLLNTTHNTIQASLVAANGRYGINLINADNTLIACNIVAFNGQAGINLDSASSGTVQYGNFVFANNTNLHSSWGANNCSSNTSNCFSDADNDVGCLSW